MREDPMCSSLRHHHRAGSYQALDVPMQTHAVTPRHTSDRYHPGVLDQTTSKPASEAGLELGVILAVTLTTVVAPEPPVAPHQRCPTAARL